VADSCELPEIGRPGQLAEASGGGNHGELMTFSGLPPPWPCPGEGTNLRKIVVRVNDA
jgi:hypothetical protein